MIQRQIAASMQISWYTVKKYLDNKCVLSNARTIAEEGFVLMVDVVVFAL